MSVDNKRLQNKKTLFLFMIKIFLNFEHDCDPAPYVCLSSVSSTLTAQPTVCDHHACSRVPLSWLWLHYIRSRRSYCRSTHNNPRNHTHHWYSCPHCYNRKSKTASYNRQWFQRGLVLLPIMLGGICHSYESIRTW